MRIEELELVCQEAARTIAGSADRPLRPRVVLPLPTATKVLELPEWPDDDPSRFDLLEAFARDVMRPALAPCYGFVAEAVAGTADDEAGGAIDVVLVAFGARRHHPRLTAAVLTAEGLGPFEPSEELLPTALPFLSPLQHAADAAETSPDVIG